MPLGTCDGCGGEYEFDFEDWEPDAPLSFCDDCKPGVYQYSPSDDDDDDEDDDDERDDDEIVF